MTKKIMAFAAAFIMSLGFSLLIMMADGVYTPSNPEMMIVLMIVIIFIAGYFVIDVLF